jgi:hypothetical protein
MITDSSHTHGDVELAWIGDGQAKVAQEDEAAV